MNPRRRTSNHARERELPSFLLYLYDSFCFFSTSRTLYGRYVRTSTLSILTSLCISCRGWRARARRGDIVCSLLPWVLFSWLYYSTMYRNSINAEMLDSWQVHLKNNDTHTFNIDWTTKTKSWRMERSGTEKWMRAAIGYRKNDACSNRVQEIDVLSDQMQQIDAWSDRV